MKRYRKKIRNTVWILITAFILVLVTGVIQTQAALSQEEMKTLKSILVDHKELFTQNDIFVSGFKIVGWWFVMGLASLASSSADLYDTCFGFIDFTTWSKVNTYIDEYQVVFGAILSLSLLCIGIILMVQHEKRPKIFVNICLAVLVISSSTFLLGKMNKFLNTDVRQEILGTNNTEGVVYETLGTCVHDLIYLDRKYGLKNLNQKNGNNALKAKATYDKFTKKQATLIDISELLKPDLVTSDSKFITEYKVSTLPSDYRKNIDNVTSGEDMISDNMLITDDAVYLANEVSDGVLWTDLFNTYYYRYTVDWGTAILQLFSMVLMFLFMSYKVIKLIFEITLDRTVAILQSANLAQTQKTIKVLEAMRDAYIVLLMSLVTIKFYMLASKYVSSQMDAGGFRGWIMLFIAFAVVDGPNIIQRVTGHDAGMSDGIGKVMSAFYGFNAAAGTFRMATGAARAAGRGIRKGSAAIKHAGENKMNKQNMDAMKKGTESASGEKTSNKADSGNKDNVPPRDGEKMNPQTEEQNNEGKMNQEDKLKHQSADDKNVPPKDGGMEQKTKDDKAMKDMGQANKEKDMPKSDTSMKDIMAQQDKGNVSDNIKSMQEMNKELSADNFAGNINDAVENENKPIDISDAESIINRHTSSGGMDGMRQALSSVEKTSNTTKKE